jgi:hypothetical protein
MQTIINITSVNTHTTVMKGIITGTRNDIMSTPIITVVIHMINDITGITTNLSTIAITGAVIIQSMNITDRLTTATNHIINRYTS